ncbi:MAG: SGNH family hydrolase, partial [Xanthobacteraceae bacterium]
MRRLTIGLLIAAGAAAIAMPAAGQQGYYWTDQPSSRYSQPPPSRDFFSFPFFGGERPRAPVIDYSKAPPPRKLETPPTSTVVVVGDSMADWLGYGLDETYAEQPDTGVVREVRATAGLIRYDPRNETLDWPAVIKDQLSGLKPGAVIVMLGLNDRVPFRDGTPGKATEAAPPAKGTAAAPAPASQAAGTDPAADHPVAGRSYDFHTDQWADLYVKRIDEMIAALKTRGVPVLWVGLPALRGTKSTSDMAYLDELYRERAERAGIDYVDIWDGFVDDQGRYAVDGPDFEGQIRRLRTADGVHFTKAGAVKLASYVDLELRRLMSNHVTPMALPSEGPSPAKPGAPRPDVGPVLPLTVSSSDADTGTGPGTL